MLAGIATAMGLSSSFRFAASFSGIDAFAALFALGGTQSRFTDRSGCRALHASR